MKKLSIWKKGKRFEVRIIDSFSGDYCIIDNDFISKKPLTEEGYLKLDIVREMISSGRIPSSYSVQ